MTRPIEPTPTLYGKDAESFLDRIENPDKYYTKEWKETQIKRAIEFLESLKE